MRLRKRIKELEKTVKMLVDDNKRNESILFIKNHKHLIGKKIDVYGHSIMFSNIYTGDLLSLNIIKNKVVLVFEDTTINFFHTIELHKHIKL